MPVEGGATSSSSRIGIKTPPWTIRQSLFVVGVCLLVGASVILFLDPRRFLDFAGLLRRRRSIGNDGSPYQHSTLDGPWHSATPGLYVYSPVLALLLMPMTALQLDTAAVVWLVARVGLIALTCALMPVPALDAARDPRRLPRQRAVHPRPSVRQRRHHRRVLRGGRLALA